MGKRIQELDIEAREISCVTGHNSQTVDARSGSDHCIQCQIVLLANHQARPLAENLRIHDCDLMSEENDFQPSFDLICFRWVLRTSNLDAILNFTNDDGRNRQFLCWNCRKPRNDSSVWTLLS